MTTDRTAPAGSLLRTLRTLEWAGTSQLSGMRFCMGCTATWWKGAADHKPACSVVAAIKQVEALEAKIAEWDDNPVVVDLGQVAAELREILEMPE